MTEKGWKVEVDEVRGDISCMWMMWMTKRSEDGWRGGWREGGGNE